MKRPNFFIVGAPKCGTTALYQYLNEHPQIYMSDIKEPAYFRQRSNFKTEADYLALFAGARDEIRLGEATPSYLRSPEATEAIYRFDPDAKIIIMLRDPVSLMMSTYSQDRVMGREKSPTFAEALANQAGKTEAKWGESSIYKNLPILTDHVRRYFDRFGRENVHVIIFDDLKQDPAAVYRNTLVFLQVDPDFMPDFRIVNARRQVRSEMLQKLLLATGINVRQMKRTKLAHRLGQIVPEPIRTVPLNLLRRIYMSEQPAPSIDPQLRRELQAEFAPEVERLSQLLERDLSSWCIS